ncbi:fibronectin type III domain-containing protein [Streptacidiphilus sp. N1-12]
MRARTRGLLAVAGCAALTLGSVGGVAGTAHAGTITGTVTANAAAAAAKPAPLGDTATYRADKYGFLNGCYHIPANTTSVRVEVVGGTGADGSKFDGDYGKGGGKGGRGADVQADLPVVPGQYLLASGGGPDGGFHGGGAFSLGGDGGGSTRVYSAAACNGAAQPLVVAGGGGGGGGDGAVGKGGAGGAGGLLTGSGGGYGGNNQPAAGAGGGGGTQTAGGAGGNPATTIKSSAGKPGTAGKGGCGGHCDKSDDGASGGGGGGGGYFGGGGGGNGQAKGAGGGGGGSSYVIPGATRVSGSAGTTAAQVSITPMTGAPAAPTGVSAVAGNQRATVSFTPPTLDGGKPVTGYTVYAKTTDPGYDQTVTTNGSPVVVRDLTAGQAYTFTVTATNALGEGFPSPPSAPVTTYRTPLKAVITSATPGDGRLTVTATPAAADASATTGIHNPITSYTATVRPGVNVTTGPGVSVTAAVTPVTTDGVTSYNSPPITVTGLTDGANYTVTVHATNLGGNGPESAPAVVAVQGLPGAPTDVTANNATPVGATTGTVDVAFTPPAVTGGRPLLSYTVVSSPGGLTATVAAGAPDIEITGLTIGTSYTFTVHATTGTGDGPASDPSNPVTPTPVGIPGPPLTPGAATLDEAAYVSCSAPFQDGGSPITSYTVTASPGGITATGPSCPILVTGLTDGTAYTFTVTATNADGGTSQPSQPTGAITPHVPSGTPPANDDFANAQPISGTSGSVSGSNIGATQEPGEQTIQDHSGGASVWYLWTVPETGSYQIDTCSAYPGFNSIIGMFLGNSVTVDEFGAGPSPDQCPAGEAGSTIVTGTLSAGITLHLKVDGVGMSTTHGFAPSQGPFTLEWAEQPAP